VCAAVLTGLELGYFVADFTGWDHLHAQFHWASDAAATEGEFVNAQRVFIDNLPSWARETGSADYARFLTLVSRLRLAVAGNFYATLADIANNGLWNAMDPQGWADRRAAWAGLSTSFYHRQREAVPGYDASTATMQQLYTLALRLPVSGGRLSFTVHSPVNLLVTDPWGNRVGTLPDGTLVNEIPEATYTGPAGEPEAIVIPSPTAGNYRLEIFGTGTGSYRIEIASYDWTGRQAGVQEITGEAAPGEKRQLDFALDTQAKMVAIAGEEQPVAVTGLIVSPAIVRRAPGKGEKVEISFSLSCLAKVEVAVRNQGGSTVAVVLPPEQRPQGTVRVVWELRDALGEPVPDGEYTVVVSAESGRAAAVATAMVTVSTRTAEGGIAPSPRIKELVPADGATGVAVDTEIKIVFDQEMLVVDLSGVVVEDVQGNVVAGIKVALTGETLTIAHPPLAYNTVYRVLLPARSLKNRFGLYNEAVSWSFITGALHPAPSPVLFGDLGHGYWARTAIEELCRRGIVSGYPDGTFRPDKGITRTEATMLLTRALKLSPGTEEFLRFKDRQEIPGWARGAVAAAVKEGLISGYPEGKTFAFRGARQITRTEFAAIIARVLVRKLGRISPVKLTFKDSIKVPLWARDAVGIAVARGLVSGYPDGTFRGGKPVSRAEAASMILGLLKAIGEK
jgi:hypothetical protein